VAALAVLVNGTGIFRDFELRTVDLRFRLRGPRAVRTPLAVVFIGDDSIEGLGRWPWGWEQHALMIDVLRRAGARLVLFDVLFSEPPSIADERVLAMAARQAGNVHLISAFRGLDPPDPAAGEPFARGAPPIEPTAALRAAAAGVGHATALPDSDSITRRVPLLVRGAGGLYPSAALRVAADVLGVPPAGVVVAPGGRAIELRPPGKPAAIVPVDEDGTTPITFPGGIEAFPVRYSFLQVLQADAHPGRGAVDLEQLRGRIVLVGATFTGNTDLRGTPFSSHYPMLLVQASMIDTILRGDFVHRLPAWASIAVCILLGALLGAVSSAFRPLVSLGFTALAGGGYAAAAVLAFTHGNWLLELIPPLTAILAAYVLVTTAQYVEARAEKLRAIERLTYLGHLVESAEEAIFSFDPQGRLVSRNPAAARLFGWRQADERAGRHWTDLADEEGRRAIEAALARLDAGGDAKAFELRLAAAGGRTIPVELSLSRILDAEGRTVGTSVIAQDLTEKKRMLEVLIQSEKLAEIGRMGSGIVHEIKNPLTSIMMMSDIIHGAADVPEKTRKYADIIQKESQRILRLSQNILSFARPQKPEMRATDLNRVLADTLGLTEYEMKKGKVRVHEEYDPAAPPVWGDGEKLKQVFLNLAVNAAHAMAGGGDLAVRTLAPGGAPPTPPEGGAGWSHAAVGERPAGPFVTAQVQDHGTGIPAEILARVFEPFFSTKGEGKGTGLGLYISRNIVLEHKGRIVVASRPGAGTVFTVELPAAGGDAAA
jgi:PAS domain S-box-containing protein